MYHPLASHAIYEQVSTTMSLPGMKIVIQADSSVDMRYVLQLAPWQVFFTVGQRHRIAQIASFAFPPYIVSHGSLQARQTMCI